MFVEGIGVVAILGECFNYDADSAVNVLFDALGSDFLTGLEISPFS